MPEDKKDDDLDADDPSEEEEEPSVEVDGEKIPIKEAVEAYKNRRDWQKASTQRDQELADARRQLSEITSKVIDKLGDKDDRPEESDDEVLSRLDNLPDPITEKEAFHRELKETFKAVKDWAKEKAEASASQQTAAAKKEFQNQLEARVIEGRIVDSNYRLLDERLAEVAPGISKADRAKVENEIRGYHGPNHGTWVNLADGGRVFQYAASSVDMAVRALGIKGKAAPAAKPSGSHRRVVSDEAEELPEPPDTASLSEKLAYIQSLPEDRVAEKFARMSQKDKDEIYKIHIQSYKR